MPLTGQALFEDTLFQMALTGSFGPEICEFASWEHVTADEVIERLTLPQLCMVVERNAEREIQEWGQL